jgi:hypothetical protein
MGEGDTLMNALIGAVVSIVLSPLQFSPVIGGTVAGYLQGSDSNEGVQVGALSGLFTAIPLLCLVGIISSFMGGFFFLDGSMPLMGGAPFLIVIFAVLLVFAFTVALSAVGGFLGAYLNREDVI